MKSKPGVDITLPDLSPEAAYALVCWLEGFTHDVSLYYSDEVRSELMRRDAEADEDINDGLIPF